jgi:chondroitin AC lyase
MPVVALWAICLLPVTLTEQVAKPNETGMQADMQVIKERLVRDLLRNVGEDQSRQAKQWADSLQADGTWPDVDYADQGSATWRTFQHLQRLATMARAFRGGTPEVRGDGKLKSAILAALDLWEERDFRSPNWWWNEIGVPETLGDALLLLEQDLDRPRLEKGVNILSRAVLGKTGQNLVWLAQINIVRGSLLGDADTVGQAFGLIAQEIQVTAGEGIQADMSFHQHGAQLYSGGYGLGFSGDCARLGALARGTAFAFPVRKVELLSGYILDGQQWTVRGSAFDYGAMGREITRKRKSARPLLPACRYMSELDTPRRAEFEAFARRLEGGQQAVCSGPIGNRYFWRSDFMAHRREGYYTSVKMASVRTEATEAINGEGLRSYHIGDGMTLILRRGDEYEGIFPIWDWRRLPGITCEQSDEPLPDPTGVSGQTSFVGGVSDGTYGVAAYDFAKDGLSARKAWFYFDHEFVALGTGIACAGDNPVLTSLNQCFLKGDVVVFDGRTAATAARGQSVLAAPCWVHHDGVGYVLPVSVQRQVVLKADAQTGSWWDINRQYGQEQLSADVFSLWIDHGPKPQAAGYEYVVVPGVSAAELDAYAKDLPVRVPDNRPALQAVCHRQAGVTGAAFYEAGSLRLDDGMTVSVDRPCLLLLACKDGDLQVAVANPENQPLAVQVDINRRLAGKGCAWLADSSVSRISFSLPDGQYAGQSVVRRLRPAPAGASG